LLEHTESKSVSPSSFPIGVIGNEGDAAEIMAQCSEKLIGLNNLTEKDFLTAGKELHAILTRSKQISETAISASELVNNQDAVEDIENLQRVFDLINEYFQQSQSKLHKSAEDLLKMNALIDDVRSPLSSFGRIVKHLHILGISTKIENARVISSDNSFYLLAEDVEKMSLVIAAKSEDINKGLLVLRRLTESVYSKITVLKDREYEKAQNALDKTRDVLTKLMEKKSTSAITTGKLADRSRDVSARISGVVSSLQFHDITRQQIEHVVETLNDVKVMGSSGAKKKNVVTALMGRIGDLQIHQLKNAREEFLSAVRRVIADLQGVAANVLAMSRETKDLLGSAGKDGSSFLAEMTSSLSSVISFSVENENTQKQLFESLDSISGTMGELSEFVAHIEGIGSEIELIALNARVKAAHAAAAGAALGIIAEAITKLSDGARNQTQLIAGMLKHIRDAVERINDVGERKDNETVTGIRELTGNAENLSRSMRQADEKIIYLLNNLERETTELAYAVNEIVNDMGAHKQMEKVTLDIIDQLSRITDRGRSLVIEDESQEITDYMNSLTDRYTMNKERFIHQSHVGGTDFGAEATYTDNDLGDNVELF